MKLLAPCKRGIDRYRQQLLYAHQKQGDCHEQREKQRRARHILSRHCSRQLKLPCNCRAAPPLCTIRPPHGEGLQLVGLLVQICGTSEQFPTGGLNFFSLCRQATRPFGEKTDMHSPIAHNAPGNPARQTKRRGWLARLAAAFGWLCFLLVIMVVAATSSFWVIERCRNHRTNAPRQLVLPNIIHCQLPAAAPATPQGPRAHRPAISAEGG